MPIYRSRRSASLLTLVLCIILMLGTLAPAAHAATYTAPTSKRAELALDAGWKFKQGTVSGAEQSSFDDSSWSTVQLPHTWNHFDGQDGGNNYYRGVGWYRLRYTVASAYAGRRFYLQFNGANLVTDAWVNGTYLGQHRGGYAAFRFDATPAIRVGAENVIAVKVNNAYNADIAPLSADFTFFGGLYRNVRLVTTDPLHLRMTDYGSSAVYIKQSNVSASAATIQVRSKVWNDHAVAKNVTINTVIVDAASTIVATLTTNRIFAANSGAEVDQTTVLSNPRLWNGRRDPYLYRVYVEIRDGLTVVDLVMQPLGIRSFSIDANQGFFLNGRYLDLHGVNRHQDRLNKGWAISTADQDEDMNLIKEIGATAIRLAHYQHDSYFYDLADRAGMILWTEIPLINSVTSTTAFNDNARQQMIELIRQNYNHPSIVFWGIANEVDWPSTSADPNPLLAQLADVVAAEDPDRISTIADATYSDTDPTTDHSETVGYNRYYGWYHDSYDDFDSWIDGLHASRPTRKLAMSEYGAGASIAQHATNPTRPDPSGAFHPEEYQSQFHEAYWNALKTRPFVWGKFVWNMFDFASDGRDEGDAAGRNDKGLVTYDRRTRKDAFYWYKANWSDQPFVYITSRRYTDRSTATVDVKIYANTDSVELTVNGSSRGSKTSANHIFVWTGVPLNTGANTIAARGLKNGVAYTDSVAWTRRDSAIVLPGVVQAEDYRTGGKGVGYYDTTSGNTGAAYRADDVDIQATADNTGAYNIAWITAGEWLAYDVNVTTGGSYTFGVRVSSPYSGKRFHIELDGINVSGAITVPNTGGWQSWTHVWTKWIPVTAGPHTLRLVAETDAFNANFIEAWHQ
jgi:beta-galactosidase